MLTQFLEINPFNRKLEDFTPEQLKNSKDQISHGLYDFLLQQGEAVYGDDFFWIVLPSDYHEILSKWGLDGKKCYAFLRSSFGCIAYFYQDDFYVLNSMKGTNTIICGNNIDLLFNLALAYEGNLEYEFCLDLHKANRSKLPALKRDEMYSLEKPIAKKGKYNSSAIKVANLKEELIYLADLFGNKVRE